MNKRLAGADGTVGGYQAPHRRVEDLDFPQQVRLPCAEHLALTVLDHHQLAVTQVAELTQHGLAQQRAGQAIDVQAIGFDR